MHTMTRTDEQKIPWTIWAGILGVTSASIGGAWDVAWHRSIGRDSFLTPPHIAIYACGVMAAVVCGYLVFATTFGSSRRMRAEAVNVWGLRAPLGAFLAAWGGVAMLTSAPFDNWWHAAYGLDVKIISPPHTLLIMGIRMVSIGILFLILAAMNRSEGVDEKKHRTLLWAFLYMGGLMLTGQMFFTLEQTWDVFLHGTGAYITLGIAVPVSLAIIARASGYRWACTVAAAIYTAFALLELWVFPLAPASPKLGPVFFPVTHLVPAKFPILLIGPAIALDVLWYRLREWKPWKVAAISGVVFVALMFAVEWPFASFLMSKASQNRFFGTIYFDYNSRPQGYDRMRMFYEPVWGMRLAIGLVKASVYASVGTFLGFVFGKWMRGVQR